MILIHLHLGFSISINFASREISVDNQSKTKSQLIEELRELRERYDSLKKSSSNQLETNISQSELLQSLDATTNQDISDFNKLENELSQSEQKHRLLMEQSGLGIGYYDLSGTCLIMNKKALNNMSAEAENVVGKNVSELFGNEMGRTVLERFEKVLAAKQPLIFEDLVSFPNGDRWYRSTISAIPDESGEITGFQIISDNITETKLAEEKLLASNERLVSMFDNHNAVMLFVESKDGKIIDANNAAVDFYGYSRDQMHDMTIYDINMLEKGQIQSDMQKAYRNEQNKFVFPHRLSNGEVRNVEVHSSPIVVQGKDHLFSIIYDVTDKLIAETALRDSESRFRSYVKNSPYGVFIADNTGKYLEINPAACRITGYSEDELLAMSTPDLIPDDARETAIEHFTRLLETGHSSGEVPFLNKGGERRVWSVEAVKVSEDRFLGFTQDVTMRHYTQETLQKSEEDYRALIDAIPDLLFRIDSNLLFTFAHSGSGEVLLAPREEAEGKSIHDILPGELAKITRHHVEAALTSGEPQQFDFSLEMDLGVQYYEARMIQCNKNEVVVLMRNLTDQKRADQALFDSKERLINSQKIARMGDVVWEVETGKVTWSEGMYHLCQYAPNDELDLEKVNSELHHPDDLERINSWLEENLASGQSELTPNEYRIIRKDGKVLHVHVEGRITREKGQSTRILASIQDITERKIAEESQNAIQSQFDQERKRLLNTFEKIPAFVYLQAPDYSIKYANSRFKELFGEPDSKPCFELIHSRSNPCEICPTLEVLKTGRRVNWEWKRNDQEVYKIYDEYIDDFDGTPVVMEMGVDITDQKKSEEDLLKERMFLQKAQEIGKIGTWELDIQKDELLWTDENYRIFGLPVGTKLTYEIFLNCVHPEDKEYVDRKWKAAFNGDPYDIEHRLLVDGKVKWVREKAKLEFDDNGKCIRGTGVTQDITDRKSAEGQLLLQSLVLDQIQDRVTVTDLEGIITYVNEAEIRALGYSRNDLIGSSTDKYGEDPERGATQEDIVKTTLRDGHWRGEVVNYTADGREIIMDCRTHAVQDSKGEVVALCGVATDITDQKLAEQNLLNLENRYRSLINHSPVCHKMIDLDFNLQFMSVNGFRMLKLEQNDNYYGRPYPFDFFPKPAREVLIEGLSTVKATGKIIDLESQACDSEGSTVWLYHTIIPVFNEDDRIDFITVVSADITERKTMEQQLHQSQKMESIGRLAGGVAHDFNNLLTAIQGFSDLIQDSLLQEDPLQNDVREIQRAAESASTLTRQLLGFSRKQVISPKVIDLNKTIANSEKMLRRIIGEDIDFSFKPGKNLGRILIDPGQVDQILINLGVNSRDAMPKGGKLTIETKTVKADSQTCHTCDHPMNGDLVMLSFQDNGIGMDQETIKNLFEPFFTTKGVGKGTGLGLSTVHGIVHQNNGHIQVISTPGEGSTFELYFEIVNEKEEITPTEDETTDIRGSETILLVEDQGMVRRLAKNILKKYGYKIIEAENGGDAFVKFEEMGDQIDLVVTDVVMPTMSGKQLYDRLINMNPKLKVLFMSGYTDDTIENHGVLDKKTNFIQKPFRPKELAAKVRQVLDS